MSDSYPNTPVGGETPTSTAPSSTPVTPATTTPVTPASATPTPQEDRSNWVPPHRLREISQRHEAALQAERARYMAEIEQREARIRALAGVTPPPNQEVEEVKKQFGQLYPGLAKLEAQAAQVEAILAKQEELNALQEHVWAIHNKNAMDKLYSLASETYGENLNDDAKRMLGSHFIGYLNTNPDAYQRYQNDPSVVVDFWKDFTGRFIDPVRRASTAATMQRIPTGIPQDSPSGAVATSQAAPKPANQDERLARALAVYKANSRYGFGE